MTDQEYLDEIEAICKKIEKEKPSYRCMDNYELGHRTVVRIPKRIRDGMIFYCSGWGWRLRLEWRKVLAERTAEIARTGRVKGDVKAWRVDIPRLGDTYSIYAGESPGEVRYIVLLGIWDSYGGSISFPDVDVIRAPEFDLEAKEADHRDCIGWKSEDGLTWGCLSSNQQPATNFKDTLDNG